LAQGKAAPRPGETSLEGSTREPSIVYLYFFVYLNNGRACK